MFEKLKIGHKIGSVASKWVAATSVDPGDNGQVMKKAYEYIENLGLHPEDAWLTALVTWMDGMPWKDSKEIIAQGIFKFLEEYEGKIALSAGAIINAREHAYSVLSNEDDDT
jgi:hypothetical protein